MMTRRSAQRKYSPFVECLERKQLLSPGLQAGRVDARVPLPAPEATQRESVEIRPPGTGKGIVIITRL
jgi:hypothetical protein